jgi:uncharacterized protein YbaR (Trm112 family)
MSKKYIKHINKKYICCPVCNKDDFMDDLQKEIKCHDCGITFKIDREIIMLFTTYLESED